MSSVSFLRIRHLCAVLIILQFAACGGGGDTVVAGGGAGGTGYVDGVATKGPVGNAMVIAYGIAGATTSGIQVTPLTTMAQVIARQMTGGMTTGNIAAANSAMGSYLSVTDIVHVQPMNPMVQGSGATASQDARNYGMTLAAMSTYAQTLGMSSSSAIVTALMNDAADGMMDGKAGSVSVPMGGMTGGMMGSTTLPCAAGTTGLGAAMNAFMTSGQNKSGITTPGLMNRLMGYDGRIMGNGPMTACRS